MTLRPHLTVGLPFRDRKIIFCQQQMDLAAFHFRPAVFNLLESPDDSITKQLRDTTRESYRLAGRAASLFSIERTYYKLWINTDNRRVRQTSHAAVSDTSQILGAGCQTRECEVDGTGCAKCGRGRSCNNHIPSIC